jgi:hypothetical protein
LAAPCIGRADPASDELERQRQENKQLQQQLAELKKLLEVQQQQIAELKEAKRIRDLLAENELKLAQRQKEIAELRSRLVEAQVQAASVRNRNEQLLVELEKVLKEMQKVRAGNPPALDQKSNPPAEAVEGVIKKVENALVIVSIGKDAGLEKGHTLEVYRIEPKPTYLGRIRIIEVAATTAVGQVMDKPHEAIKIGDKVASTIKPLDKPKEGPKESNKVNPPPEQLEGLVKEVKEDGQVVITLGSDAGLQQGQTLEVFRINADPPRSVYLGRIRIVEVKAATAVGKAMGKLAQPIMVGDTVASRILSGN